MNLGISPQPMTATPPTMCCSLGSSLCLCISCFLNLELSLFFIPSAAGKYPVCYVALIQQSEMCSGVILRIPGVMRWREDTVPHWYYILTLLRMISTFLLHLSVQWTDTKQQLKKKKGCTIIDGVEGLMGWCTRPGGNGAKGDSMSSWAIYLLILE